MSLAIGIAILLLTAVLMYGLLIASRRPAGSGAAEDFWVGNVILPSFIAALAFGIAFVIQGLLRLPGLLELAVIAGELALFAIAWAMLRLLYRRLRSSWQATGPEHPQPRPLRNGAIAGKRGKHRLRRAA